MPLSPSPHIPRAAARLGLGDGGAALALVHSARAWALLEGRDKVIPEDVQAILPGVAAHRLRPAHDSARRIDVGAKMLTAVPIP